MIVLLGIIYFFLLAMMSKGWQAQIWTENSDV